MGLLRSFWPTKRSVQGGNDFTHLRARQRIINTFPVSARFDEIINTQAGQLLRYRGLAKIEHFFDLGDRLFTLAEKAEDKEAPLM